MNLEDLLEYLDIETPDEFEYFENIADLIEADAEISPDILYVLFSEMDMEVLADLIANYFDEVTDNLPDDAIEIYTLLNTVKMALMGMAKNIDDDHDMVLFSEEFSRVREWYSLDLKVMCIKLDPEGEKTEAETVLSLRDALVLFRMEKLGEEKYIYDFEDCLDFEMDEYTMTFAELLNEDSGDESDLTPFDPE